MADAKTSAPSSNPGQSKSGIRMDQDACYPFHKKVLSCMVGHQSKNYTSDQSKTMCLEQVKEYKRCMEQEFPSRMTKKWDGLFGKKDSPAEKN